MQLITRADDAGCCSAANRAIVAALAGGVLKNVSIMVPGPAFAQAAEMLAGIDGIDLGLHVTLNSEWPIARWGPVSAAGDVPALVDEHGYFFPDPEVLNDSHPPVVQMIDEIARQLDRARKLKLSIAYMDEHMGVGWLAGFRDGLRRLAEREAVVFVEKKFRSLKMGDASGGDAMDRLGRAIAAMTEPAAVLVTHPIFDDASAQAMLDGRSDRMQIIADREADRRLWLDDRLPTALARVGAIPVRYSDAV